MKGEMYLKKPQQFAMVHTHGKWYGSALLGIKSYPNGLALARWGIVVSKKIGGAVERNRVKRRLREIMRRQRVLPGVDVVIITRPGIAAATFCRLEEDVHKVLLKSGLVDSTT